MLGGGVVAGWELVGMLRLGQGFGLAEVCSDVLVEAMLVAVLLAVPSSVAAVLAPRSRWVGLAVAAVASALLLGAVVVASPSPPERAARAEVGGASGARTVVFVTLDTLRLDHVSAYPGALIEGLTPALEALAADGIRFDGARAPAPLTLPAHISMLTGRLPVDHGIVRNGTILDPALPGLPAVLSARGYQTAAFVSSSVLHGAHGPGRWFQTYRDRLGERPARELLLVSRYALGVESAARLQKEPGDRTVDRALAWLDAVDEGPVFLWVHLYDAHAPHAERPPEGGAHGAFDRLPHPCDYAGHPAQRARLAPVRLFADRPALVDEAACRQRDWAALRRAVGTYAGEVAFADAQLGRLVQGLRARGRWRDTALVVAADHGESLTEHQQTVSHQFSTYEPVLRVPLIVRPAGGRGESPAVVDAPVGTVQVAPTLARMAGVPEGTIGGIDLLSVAQGAAAGPEVAVAVAPSPLPGEVRHAVVVAEGGRKVVSLGGGRYERYDLAVDALERFPLRAATDAPTPEPPGAQRATRPRRSLGLPLLPDPRDLLDDARRHQWPRPEDELSWRPLDADQAADFAPLERRADTVLDAVEQRGDPEGDAHQDLPDDVREALEALGYLH